jgi:Tol biopolymer transport system component
LNDLPAIGECNTQIPLRQASKDLGQFGEPGLFSSPEPSPDGRLVGLVRTDPNTGRGDVWVADTRRNTLSRSTFADGTLISYAFSPDAQTIAVTSTAAGSLGEIWIQPTNGSGNHEKLETLGVPALVTSWSANGRYLFFTSQNNAARLDIYYLDLNSDRKSTPFLNSPANETGAVLSPNGK